MQKLEDSQRAWRWIVRKEVINKIDPQRKQLVVKFWRICLSSNLKLEENMKCGFVPRSAVERRRNLLE